MPPINDSGYPLVLGPDSAGRFVTVPEGGRFEHPAPPKTVSELELEAALAKFTRAGDAAQSATQDLADTVRALQPATPKKTKPAQDTEASK